MRISATTRACALIGDPVEHSLSPVMHNAAFENLNMDFVYLAFRIKKDELEGAMAGINGLSIHGLNVTMPHKKAVMEYLNEVDPTAKSIDAVNTILNVNGRLMGYNTDGIGALKALKGSGIILENKKLVLLGAGGAGKSIAFHVAQETGELVILNRTLGKAKELADSLHRKLNRKVTAGSLSPETLMRELSDAHILINATSVGMYPRVDASPVDQKLLRPDLCVMDIVYNPVVTNLARDAGSLGAKVVSGVDMLVYQGAASFEIWMNRPAPVEAMKQAALSELSRLGF